MEKIRSYSNLAKSNAVLIIALSITVLLFMVLLLHLKSILIIATLMLIGSLSHIHMRFISWVGIELCLVVAIVLGWLFGPLVGMLGGFITVIIADILGACISETSLISYLMTGAVGFVAGFLGSIDLMVVGMVLVVFYSIVTVAFYVGLGLAIPLRSIAYAITHTLFSWWVLWTVGPLVANLAV